MFKRAVPFKDFWENGSQDLREIIFNPHDMSIESWMQLYSYNYNHTHTHTHTSFYHTWITFNNRAFYDYMCSNGSDMKELYGQVSGLFDERCSQVFEKLYKINDNETEKVIQTYLESRCEYDDRKKVIDHILNYLNNSWVYKSINTGVPDVYKVRVKADVIWRTSMFSHGIHQKLTSSILSLITADRTGGIINEAAIKSCVNDFCKKYISHQSNSCEHI